MIMWLTSLLISRRRLIWFITIYYWINPSIVELGACKCLLEAIVDLQKKISLQWHHNDHDGVSNHQPHGCLLNRLFGRRSTKPSKLRVTGLCAGNSPGPVNSPHKGPVTRKMFPFDDVIMIIVNGVRFALGGVTCGVPQRCVLGSFLFIVYKWYLQSCWRQCWEIVHRWHFLVDKRKSGHSYSESKEAPYPIIQMVPIQ